MKKNGHKPKPEAAARALAVQPARADMTPEQVALLKKVYFSNAPDEAVALALYLCKKYGLDPLAREVMLVPRKARVTRNGVEGWETRWTPMVGRDGFLSIAHRNPQFLGMKTETLRDEKGAVVGARTTVSRRDWLHPIIEDVSLSEYRSDSNPLWASKPHTMIRKVAESQALRKAFRIDGLYAPEEFGLDETTALTGGADSTIVVEAPKPPAPVAAPAVAQVELEGGNGPGFDAQEVAWIEFCDSTGCSLSTAKSTAIRMYGAELFALTPEQGKGLQDTLTTMVAELKAKRGS